MYICICMYLYLSLSLSIYLSIYLSVGHVLKQQRVRLERSGKAHHLEN